MKNEQARKKIGDAVSFTDVWKARQLLFLGQIARLNGKCLPVLLTATTDGGKICRGRPLRTIRDALIDFFDRNTKHGQ